MMSYPDSYGGNYGGKHNYPVYTTQPHSYKYGAASVAGYETRSGDRSDRHKRSHYETRSDKGPYYNDKSHARHDDSRHYNGSPISAQPRASTQMQRHWQTGLCDCHKDMKTCLCVLCCSPCYEWYLIQNDFDESCWTGVCCSSFLSFLALRYRFRDRQNIQGSLLEDACAMSCCGPCAVCQLKREHDLLEEPNHSKHDHSLAKHMEERAHKYRY